MGAIAKIRLELAREKEHPEGDRAIGYEFKAPLDRNGKIDAERWQLMRDRCQVRRFRDDCEDEVGHLVRKGGGSWAFHYDVHGDPQNDEAGFKFGDHQFKVGEYVSVREDDELRPYRVASVKLGLG